MKSIRSIPFENRKEQCLKRKRINAKGISFESIQAYSDLISSVAAKYQSVIEPDDLQALAYEGFLLACYAWNPAYCDFESFARYAINNCLSTAKKQYTGNFGASIDAPLKGKTGCLGDTIRAASVPAEETLYYRILIDRLKRPMKEYVQYCMHGYSEDEIRGMLVLSADELESLKKEIQKEWKEYDPEMFV